MASKTVLVIDADNETEQFIASVLETEGYLVFAVPGGDVGAEMAQKVSPSLIFVDPGDTREKGMEVCRAIRGYDSLKTVPIILLASVPEGTDPGSYGVVDSLSLPADADYLLEKTEKAIDAKSPFVVRVRGKTRASLQDEAHAAQSAAAGEGGTIPSKSRLSDLSEIAEMEEEAEDTGKGRKRPEATAEFSYVPEEEVPAGRKGKKTLVALLAILVIVVGVAAVLYFTGLIPGIGLQPKAPVPPAGTVAKPMKPEPAPAAEPEKEAVAGEMAPAPAPSAPAPEAAKAVPAAKPSGKKVYSVQVGAFSSEANAEALTRKMKEKGYDAFTLKSSVKDKGVVYRVLIGKFEGRKESRGMVAEIRKKEKISPVIFSE